MICVCFAVGLVGGGGSAPPGPWLCMLSPAGWLPRVRDQLRPLMLNNEYGKPLLKTKNLLVFTSSKLGEMSHNFYHCSQSTLPAQPETIHGFVDTTWLPCFCSDTCFCRARCIHNKATVRHVSRPACNTWNHCQYNATDQLQNTNNHSVHVWVYFEV